MVRSEARLGILSAMPSEIARLRECVLEQVEYKRGECFSFSTGVLEGKPVVFGASGVGMVFAASAVTTMIAEFNATMVIFTGVAGGLKPGQEIGDLVLGAVCGDWLPDALWHRNGRPQPSSPVRMVRNFPHSLRPLLDLGGNQL